MKLPTPESSVVAIIPSKCKLNKIYAVFRSNNLKR